MRKNVFNKLKPRHRCNTAVDCADSLDPPRLDRAQVQNWPNYAFVKPGTGQVARPCTWLLVVRNMMRPSEPRQAIDDELHERDRPNTTFWSWSIGSFRLDLDRRDGAQAAIVSWCAGAAVTTRVVVWTVEPKKTRVGDGQTTTVYLRAPWWRMAITVTGKVCDHDEGQWIRSLVKSKTQSCSSMVSHPLATPRNRPGPNPITLDASDQVWFVGHDDLTAGRADWYT